LLGLKKLSQHYEISIILWTFGWKNICDDWNTKSLTGLRLSDIIDFSNANPKTFANLTYLSICHYDPNYKVISSNLAALANAKSLQKICISSHVPLTKGDIRILIGVPIVELSQTAVEILATFCKVHEQMFNENKAICKEIITTVHDAAIAKYAKKVGMTYRITTISVLANPTQIQI
jgi:hypothetical protein